MENLHKNFQIATHNTFIVESHILKKLIINFSKLPINKLGSCCFERLFGLSFLFHNYKLIPINDYFIKISGKRN